MALSQQHDHPIIAIDEHCWDTALASRFEGIGSNHVGLIDSRLKDFSAEAERLMTEVDALGGMTTAVASGMPKRPIEEAVTARQARVDRGADAIVGVNKSPVDIHSPIDTLEVDNLVDSLKVRDGHVARIAKMPAGRDEARCLTALSSLAAGTKKSANLLELAVGGARADATLMFASSEQIFGRYGKVPTPVKGFYSAAFAGDERYTQVGEGVEAVERRLGRPPKMMVAKMGQDGHDRGLNVIASAFADMGFAVVPVPLFRTPRETCEMALAEEVDAVRCSSLAAGHKTLIPELIAHRREAGRADINVVAGGVIPPKDYDFLRQARVQGVYTKTGVGTQVAEGKEVRVFDGEECILGRGILADLSFVKAWKADETGDCVFRKIARKPNLPAATCGKVCVVEVAEPVPKVEVAQKTTAKFMI